MKGWIGASEITEGKFYIVLKPGDTARKCKCLVSRTKEMVVLVLPSFVAHFIDSPIFKSTLFFPRGKPSPDDPRWLGAKEARAAWPACTEWWYKTEFGCPKMIIKQNKTISDRLVGCWIPRVPPIPASHAAANGWPSVEVADAAG